MSWLYDDEGVPRFGWRRWLFWPFHIAHEGEELRRGLNLGWGRMGVRLISHRAYQIERAWYLRVRHPRDWTTLRPWLIWRRGF